MTAMRKEIKTQAAFCNNTFVKIEYSRIHNKTDKKDVI